MKTIVSVVACVALLQACGSQDQAARDEVLGTGTVRVAIEAGTTFGWERYLGARGAAIGMTSFGASAPIEDLYRHFGITAEAAAAKAKELLAAGQ